MTNIQQPEQLQPQTPKHGGPLRDLRLWASVMSTAVRAVDIIAQIIGWHL